MIWCKLLHEIALNLFNTPPGEALSTYAYGGGSVREIFWPPKNISPASLLPKNITYFYALTPVNEHKNPETMPIEGGLPLQNPEISFRLCYMPKKYHGYDFSYFGPKNITFGNIQTQKYRTYLPVSSCSECPPWEHTFCMILVQNADLSSEVLEVLSLVNSSGQ